ncbi:MAG TPA: M1 family metallopeptidase [Marmoricola sp.]
MHSGFRTSITVAAAGLLATTVATLPSDASTTGPYATAISHPVRDDMFPAYGNTTVDALHYALSLRWHRATRELTGIETLRFRAAHSAAHFSLDLSSRLHTADVRLDGRPVRVSRPDHHTIDFHHGVVAGNRYTLHLRYHGEPRPVGLRSTRVGGDKMPLGWSSNARGEGYTAQDEPFGAFTWYAVNDQPSDKALYDFRITAPKHWVGVANGRLRSRTKKHGLTRTHWQLTTPASSYLTTVGIGPYKETVDRRVPGLPITYWTPRDQPWTLKKVRYAATAVKWLENKLGRFPFPTLGILVAPQGGMETQTMITLGRNEGDLAKDTIVHEIAHHWFGDEVTPERWHDGWLNEGWATYLAEAVWASHGSASRLNTILTNWSFSAPDWRGRAGPPARPFKHSAFDGNIYYIPALMWDLVRQQVGTAKFWKIAAAWPREHRFGNADYAENLRWWDAQTGLDLEPLFKRWLLDKAEPEWPPPK